MLIETETATTKVAHLQLQYSYKSYKCVATFLHSSQMNVQEQELKSKYGQWEREEEEANYNVIIVFFRMKEST